MAANHPTVTLHDLTFFSSVYRNRKFKRKVSEFLFIKQNRHTLNKHDTSVLISCSADINISPETYPECSGVCSGVCSVCSGRM